MDAVTALRRKVDPVEVVKANKMLFVVFSSGSGYCIDLDTLSLPPHLPPS